MFDLPFLAAVIDVTISGKEVPSAIIVRPIKESEIFNAWEIEIAESTVISAPKRVNRIDTRQIGTPYRKGFLKEFFEKKSFSIFMSLTSLEKEFLKLL